MTRDAVRRRQLLRAARRGDRGALERLVVANLGMVRSVAARYRDLGLAYDDLVQEGALGLLEAVGRYDPSRGADFESFARFRVRRAIRNALSDQARVVRLPRHVVARRRLLGRAEATLMTAFGRTPTIAELASECGLSEADVTAALAAGATLLTLDDPGVEAYQPRAPDTASPESEVLTAERTQLVRHAIAGLEPRQRELVRRRYGMVGDASSMTTVAAELHVSERRARTIEDAALRRLARDLGPALGDTR